MKAGRNDPCPCGSGKKYKKCCLSKDLAASPREIPAPAPRAFPTYDDDARALPTVPAPAPPPPAPPDPHMEKLNARWEEFQAADEAGRIALFFQTLDDPELLDDEMALEMLSHLHQDAVQGGERARFAEYVAALRQRQPEVYRTRAHYYLSLLILDALAAGRSDEVVPLSRELASYAGQHLDTVERSMEALAYHGQPAALLEARRIGWPLVQEGEDIFAWAIEEFAVHGVNCEIFEYLEQTATPDPADSTLLERIRFYIPEPHLDYVAEFMADLTGRDAPAWKVEDFALAPPNKKKSRRDWDEDDEEEADETPTDPAAVNLRRLVHQFVGYLRRDEGVPYPRGELVKRELLQYFLQRHEGKLNPRLSMLEQMQHPHRKPPKAPPPSHPLCPERVTLDVYLSGLLSMFNILYHRAAALFEALPAWLRFLESRGLVAAARRARTVEELRPLHAQLQRLWETYKDDPALYHAAQAWPAEAARGLLDTDVAPPSPQPTDAGGGSEG